VRARYCPTELLKVGPSMRWMCALILLTAACNSGGGDANGSRTQVKLVYVYPAEVTLLAGATQSFDVQVLGVGLASPPARLYVEGIEGGDDRVGRVNVSGVYTAPAVPPVPNIVTLAAVSVDDPTMSASSTIVMHSRPGTAAVVVGPSTLDLAHSATAHFGATVSGTLDARVTWTVERAAPLPDPSGTIDASGVYTAPASGYCHDLVVATSVVDPTARGTAAVRCIPEPVVGQNSNPASRRAKGGSLGQRRSWFF